MCLPYFYYKISSCDSLIILFPCQSDVEDHILSVCLKGSKHIYALMYLAKLCSYYVLRSAYVGLVHPNLTYGIMLWGGDSKFKLERVFRIQKNVMRVFVRWIRETRVKIHLGSGDWWLCSGSMSLRWLCIVCSSVAWFRWRRASTLNRGRENFRARGHRTSAFERSPLEVVVKLIQ